MRGIRLSLCPSLSDHYKGIPMEEVLKQKPANIAKAFDILSQLNSSDGFFEEKRVDDIPQERE